jgi:hypothetical protein
MLPNWIQTGTNSQIFILVLLLLSLLPVPCTLQKSGIEELGIQLEEPFRYVDGVANVVLPIFLLLLALTTRVFFDSLLPQHKITNGIGLSAEEHVEWMLKDDMNNRSGRVNSINAALGPNAKQLVGSYYN